MGCAHSSKKAAVAPTLLTSRTLSNGADKGAKHTLPVTSQDELGTTPSAWDVPEAPRIELASADFTIEVDTHTGPDPSSAAKENEANRLPIVEPPEVAKVVVDNLRDQLLESLSQPPRPPVDTIKSLDSNIIASLPQSEMESFASSHSGYSASTNFTFGHRWSPPPSTRSLPVGRKSGLLTLQEDPPLAEPFWSPPPSTRSSLVGRKSGLLTLQEDAPLAETVGVEGDEDIPEYSMAHGDVAPGPEASDEMSEDYMAPVHSAVEKAVHAVVDAGEDAWDHVKSVWNTRYNMLRPIEEETEADVYAERDEVETTRRWRPFKNLDWSCAS